MSDYKDIYVCGNFIKRMQSDQSYIIVSDKDYYSDIKSIDQNKVIYENTKEVYFDSLEINSNVAVNGELLIH